MKPKITLPNGQVYRIGDVYRQPLKPEQFHKDDQASARVICSLHGFTDQNREIAVVQHIYDDEQEMTLVSGGTAARFITLSVSTSAPSLPPSTTPDPEPEPEPPPAQEPEPAPEPEPKPAPKKRGRPRKAKK